MSGKISQRAFARTAGVSSAAIRHALTDGRLIQDDDLCLDLEEGPNALFIEEHQQKAVERMEETGEVSPGWGAWCVKLPGREHPSAVCFMAPHGKTFLPSSNGAFDDWHFDDPSTGTFTAYDPRGRAHKLVLVYDKNARPPWLEKTPKAAPRKRKPRRARA